MQRDNGHTGIGSPMYPAINSWGGLPETPGGFLGEVGCGQVQKKLPGVKMGFVPGIGFDY